jgi:hypothetical protein
MGITSGQNRDMKGKSGLDTESTEELLNELKRKETNRLNPTGNLIG